MTGETTIQVRWQNRPSLHEGDTVNVHGEHGEFTVDGFRAGGMLVDCISHATGQVLCVPRFQAVGGWLSPLGNGRRRVTRPCNCGRDDCLRCGSEAGTSGRGGA